jgi:manganese/iron transport system ATP-binding protein
MYPHSQHKPDQPILDLHAVSVNYEGRHALEQITFHLHPPERIAVVGPNGAGKSTLLKVVAGVLRPTEGTVTVYGSGPSVHVCIAYVPQRSQVDWRFPVSVEDVVMMGRIAKLGLFGWPKKRDWAFVHAALETVGITDLAKRQIGQLSGGQQQRMFIARALAQEAELMLMDEPLTGLDTPSQEGLLALLGELQRKRVTVMVATHDLEQAARYFDRIMLLNHKMIAFGVASDVLKPEILLRAYGGRVAMVDGKPVTDTCCEGDEHDHAL